MTLGRQLTPVNTGRPPGGNGLNRPGQRTGTLVCQFDASAGECAVLGDAGLPVEVTTAVVAQIVSTSADDRVRSVQLSGVGHYRMSARQQGASTVVVGLSMSEIDSTTRDLAVVIFSASIIAVLLAWAAVRSVTARALRPLRSLQRASQRVSQMQLATGSVDLSVRVSSLKRNGPTEIDQVAQSFNYMLDNVAAALESRQASETQVRRFVADASHELRNPLAAIRGYSELSLRFSESVPAEVHRALIRIDSESKRMSSLVEDLLLLARLDLNVPIAVTEVEANSLIMDAVSDAMAAGPDYDWGVDLPAETVLVSANPERLHQILVNLLANVRKHTPEGTTATVILRTTNTGAVICVEDNGPGMSPEMTRMAFERFTRADSSRSRSSEGQSTGLGLAIVWALMESQHGRAEISSSPSGTTVTLHLVRSSS